MDQLDIGPALELAADVWGQSPFTPYYLDYDQPDTWPDPWTLISDNCYCDVAKALGLLYTVYLSRHGSEHDLKLRILRRPLDRREYNLVIVDDGKYVLNLLAHEVVNIESIAKDLQLLAEYTSKDLGLEKY
jgi:hypothetical protein